MYTKDQREKVGRFLESRRNGMPIAKVAELILTNFGYDIGKTTVERVFKGGGYRLDGASGQTVKNYHRQDAAIPMVATVLGADLRLVLDSERLPFRLAPQLYFPDSPAFKEWSGRRIEDCVDLGSLHHLRNACKTVRVDADRERLLVVEAHISKLSKLKAVTVAGALKTPDLPFPAEKPATAPVVVERKMQVAPEGNGFMHSAKVLIADAKAMGLPVDGLKAAILQRVAQDLGLE
jgi:hypothetical protein